MVRSRKGFSTLISFLFIFTFIIAGCGKTNSSEFINPTSTSSFQDSQTSENPNTDFKYQIFLLAQQSGYEGTYEEWIASIRGADGTNGLNGREVMLTVKDGMIVWKYSDEDDTAWRILISLNELAGVDGKDGIDEIGRAHV